MQKSQPIPDPKIIQHVSQKLASSGLRAPSRVTVTSSSGRVTLTGSIQYEHQRQSALTSARGIAGVRQVIDRMQLIPAVHRQS
jgi:osmotically-inducible protein OsmY